MLCLAGNWRQIRPCIPPVHKALRDLSLGKPLPVCSMSAPPQISTPAQTSSSPVSGATVNVLVADENFCPPQYLTSVEQESSTARRCLYSGAIEIRIGQQLWNRVWWTPSGDTVTEWSAAARAAMSLEALDDRFARDYQAWRSQQQDRPPAPQPGPEAEGGA